MNLFISNMLHLLTINGPLLLSLFLLTSMENLFMPVAGGPLLLAASISAGTTHTLSVFLLMIVVTFAGSAVGSSIGFWIGRTGGFRVLSRYGHLIRLKESKLKVGMYLFHRYGRRVALFGRCVPVLHGYAPFLAGIYQMSWLDFIVANTLGTSILVAIYGVSGYVLGKVVQGFVWIVPILALLAVLILLALIFLLFRRHQRQWEQQAEELFPGSLKEYHPGSERETSPQKEGTNERNMLVQTRSK